MAWTVLVEQFGGAGSGSAWNLAPLEREGRYGQLGVEFADRGEARAEALRLTAAHVPANPLSERDRRAYRISPDEYLVAVVGAVRSFHFRVTVAERIVPGSGEPIPLEKPKPSGDLSDRPFPGFDW